MNPPDHDDQPPAPSGPPLPEAPLVLDGMWRARAADEASRRLFSAPEADDSTWGELPVPGHWRTLNELSVSDGPVLYRRWFDPFEPGTESDRWWLEFDSIFYQGDVFLNGTYVGDTEGHFFPHSFEITELLGSGTAEGFDQHLLAVEAANSPERDRTAKRKITGVWDHWDQLDPTWNPGGITGGVRITRSGPVAIRHHRVLTVAADEQRATLLVRAVLDVAPGVETISIDTLVRGDAGGDEDEVARHTITQSVASGENRIEWRVDITDPALWWPHSLGDQALHTVDVTISADGAPSDHRSCVTGLRSIEMDDWIVKVNGTRLHVKGTNQGPLRLDHADTTAAQAQRIVDLVVGAGLDMMRLDAHIASPHLYEAADRAGLLIWQDFPLQFGYARTIRAQAQRQAREMVDLLGHHPSIMLWCAHNEPLPIDAGDDGASDPVALRKVMASMAASQALPTWNKTILDRAVARTIRRADETRPAIQASGLLPNAPTFDGTDSHLYFGWYVGNRRDLATAIGAIPRLGRFVSEFGAQAVPVTADFCEPERWPDLDWETLAERHSLQKLWFDRYVPPAAHRTFDEWRLATQTYQAELVRRQIEHLRRIKYRPNGGFAQFCFADANPAVSWSVLDHELQPKLAYQALVEACAPVIITIDEPPATVEVGDALTLDVHAVSDLRVPITAAVTKVTATWPGGEHKWGWRGELAADAATRVGSIRFIVPETRGALEFSVELEAGDHAATNVYSTEVS